MNKAQEDAAYYAVITAPVRYDPKLSSTAKLLYGEITSLCKKKGYCWSHNDHFAELYGLSESTISRLISQLEKRGHIRVETVAIATGSERRIYTDVCYAEAAPEGVRKKSNPPLGGAQKAQGGGTQKGQGGVRKKRKQNDYQGNDLSEDTPYSPPTGDGAPANSDSVDKPEPKPKRTRRDKSAPAHDPYAFETFWEAYPRKDNRKKAIDAWDKLKPDRELCRVMYGALKRQCRSEQWAEDGGKYIPMFSTWLNQRRWENQGVDLSLLHRPRNSGGWAPDPEVPS